MVALSFKQVLLHRVVEGIYRSAEEEKEIRL